MIQVLDGNHDVVCNYYYDAWGAIRLITDASGNNTTDSTNQYSIAYLNPIRYRGYYYDVETGFYYLQTRYYDPEIGRFISRDSYEYIGANGDVGSHNLFAYCSNNPVGRIDPRGCCWLVYACGGDDPWECGTPVPSGCAGTLIECEAISNSNKLRQDALSQIILAPTKTIEEKETFARAMYSIGLADEVRTGIPAELMAAQACYESGYGTSALAIYHNNIFGFIGHSYNSIDESIAAYENTLMNKSCYQKLHSGSLNDWVFGIGPAGYCPEANYGYYVMSIIERFNMEVWRYE